MDKLNSYRKTALRMLIGGLAVLSVALAPQQAKAINLLQLYIEGATYDTVSETWVFSGPGSFELWVLGNTAGPGSKGSIFDVKLSAAVATDEVGGTVSLTPTMASLVTDPSTPIAPTPTANFPSSDGAIPTLGDGSSLPTHGIYGSAGTSFLEWSLGDFTLTDSPIADFNGPLYPTTFTASAAQINAYTVDVTGYTRLHFDAYGYYVKTSGSSTTNKYISAPFSHDAQISAIPEPEIYAMMGVGLGLLGWVGRRKKLKEAAAA